MMLNENQKEIWCGEMFRIFKDDSDFECRFCAAWPIYGMRWALIILNEFFLEGIQKRLYANKYLEGGKEKYSRLKSFT